MSKYLITGGAGFIGSHLAELLLANGHDVFIIDDLSTGSEKNLPTGVNFLHADIRDTQLLSNVLTGLDGIFHLAAVASVTKSTEDWLGTHSVNLTATIGIFDTLARSGLHIPIVYASSAAVYGDQGDAVLTEASPTKPLSGYGADKLGCEQHAAVATRVWSIPTAGFRFFNVYGPRQNPKSDYSGVISIFSDRALKNQKITVHGDGQQVRDFVFVKDVANHLSAGMNWLQEQGRAVAAVFNVCTGISTTISQLALIISAAAGSNMAVDHGPARLGDIRISKGDPHLANSTLKCGTFRPLASGIAELLASYEGTA
ncbi:NAD-dependent epimerase/dehydratase family protein [Achromobacter denitrificans]|nr:NAD-dependent epimerase/dehydratase family protein [Achromobacter denitrificans]